MTGREEQLKNLNQFFESEKNNLTILYGRHRIGKTALLMELMKEKTSVYFHGIPGVSFEQIGNLNRAFLSQIEDYESGEDFEMVFHNLLRAVKGEPLLLVIEEFQNLVRSDADFMEAIANVVKGSTDNGKIMVILTSSSTAWVENSMVRAIGSAAFSIQAFMKLKELSYVDTVSLFPETNVKETLSMYAVTGGIAGYMSEWDGKTTARENICRLILNPGGSLYTETELYIRDEFRETGVYNTILGCLAAGMNKLNEIHEYTGFGRDKISVYLKNLMEREIVEKIFSYDAGGNAHTKKGIYRIKDAFVDFWFRFVYPHAGILAVTEPEKFYDTYIAPEYEAFLVDAFIKIADEFLEIMSTMGRLPLQATKRGAWHGKTGDIHLIYEDDMGRAILGQACSQTEPMGVEALQSLQELSVLAGIQAEYVYLFSTSGFTKELTAMQSEQITLIGIEEL